jgi:hypothetical protein
MDDIKPKQLQDFADHLLTMYVPDESQAERDYATESDKATELGLQDIALTLFHMSNDEKRHKGYLEDMISIIKEKIEHMQEPKPKYDIGDTVGIFGSYHGTIVGKIFDKGRWKYDLAYDENVDGISTREYAVAWEEDIQLESIEYQEDQEY